MDEQQAVILFADLSGFTALTETHGDYDAAQIAERFYALAQAALTDDARLVKTIGDAVMIVASQPSSAVVTALRLLASVQVEPGFPAVRAGLHLGPCLERSGDYFGATVNIAARVTAYARSGQILCTEPVAEAVRHASIATLQPAGIERFKNVSYLITLFEIHDPHRATGAEEFDPVCRMRLDPASAPARLPYGDRLYHFCSFNCAQKFAQAPDTYIPTI